MKLSSSQFCLDETYQFGMDSNNLILSSVNVGSLRKFCEFDNFVDENIRMSHRIYDDDYSSEPEHKNSIRIGPRYQAVIDSPAVEEDFHQGFLVSSPGDDMLLSSNKRKADSQSLENSHDDESGFCFEDSLRCSKKNCLSACFEMRSSGRELAGFFDYSETYPGESAFQAFGGCDNYSLTLV